MSKLYAIRRTLDQYDFRKNKDVFYLQIIVSLLVASLVSLKSASSSALLSTNGIGALPMAYLMVAVIAVAFHQLYEYFGKGFSLQKLIITNHMVHMSLIGILALTFSWAGEVIVPGILFYAYVAIYSVITVTLFYQYLQSILNIREAKRLYPIIGTAAIAGGIFGGYATKLVVDLLGADVLLYVVLIFLGASLILYKKVFLLNKDDLKAQTHLRPEAGAGLQLESVLKNDHVRKLVLILGIGVFVAKIVDYQFHYIANLYVSGGEALTAFFGFWHSTINLVGILFQLIATPLLIDRLGTTKTMKILPGSLMLGFVLLMFFPVLAVAILLKMLEGSMKQSIFKTATDLYYMPLSENLRNKSKTLIDVVVDSFATGLAGVFIYIVVGEIGWSPVYLNGVSIIICGVWLYAIFKGRSSYQSELVNMLHSASGLSDDHAVNWADGQKEQIKSQGQNAILNFLKGKTNLSQSEVEIDRLTTSDEIGVAKMAWMVRLATLKDKSIILHLMGLGEMRDRVLIISTLIELGRGRQFKLTLEELRSLCKVGLSEAEIEKFLIDADEYLMEELFFIVASMKWDKYYGHIRDAMSASLNPREQRAAINAIRRSINRELFNCIDWEDVDPTNLDAYQMCSGRFPRLLFSRLDGTSVPVAHKLVLIPALKYLEHQKAVNYLMHLLHHKVPKVRKCALQTIHQMRKKYPHFNYNDKRQRLLFWREVKYLKKMVGAMSVVRNDKDPTTSVELVERHYKHEIRTSVSRVFILLSLMYQTSLFDLALKAFFGKGQEKGMDYLDSVLDYKIKSQLIPLLEIIAANEYSEIELSKHKIRPSKVVPVQNLNTQSVVQKRLKNKKAESRLRRL